LMDTNALANPEGNVASSNASGVIDAGATITGFAASIQFLTQNVTDLAYRAVASTNGQVRSFSCVVQMNDNSAPVVSANSGLGDFSIMQNNAALGATSVTSRGDGSYLVKLEGYTSNGYGQCGIVRYDTQSGKGFRVTAMKDNPGPVAQAIYPDKSKQGTIVFEGDAIFGAGTISTSLVALENGASNRVLHYFTTGGSFKGFVNATSATLGFIASGAAFKSVVGFSPSSAGTALNGSAESAITPSAFSANPNVLKIGNDANGNAASSMHLRRLRIFNINLPAATKQSLTR